MKLESVELLWNRGEHNAFTDICGFNGRIFCCFREGKNHISGDGGISLIEIDQGGSVLNKNIHRFRLPQTDLRDPKLSVTPDEKLLLIAYARHLDEAGNSIYSHPVCWFSTDGNSWSAMRYFGDRNWWLWRVTWHKKAAYGFAYNRSAQTVHLYKGDPRRTFQIHKANALSLKKHGLGYPNESDILFADNGEAYALIRRDADSCTAQLGTSLPPYKNWQWHDLGEYIGGPAMIQIDADTIIVAGRMWRLNAVRTAIWSLNIHTRQLRLITTLPSEGDTSYPGLLVHNNQLWVSYYSCHVDNKSNIYLAKFGLSVT